MNIDGMVRETLHSYADDAPPATGLVDAAQARSRRRRARHASVAVVAAVAAGLLAISIPLGASSVGEGPTMPGSDPPPTFPPVELAAPPDFELPSFPFTPGWTPDGMEEHYLWYDDFADPWRPVDLPSEGNWTGTLGWSMPGLGLVHQTGIDPYSGNVLVAGIHPDNPIPGLERLAEEPVTVQGREGTRYRAGDVVFVTWQHEPNQWVTVLGSGVEARDVERYAEGLDEAPFHSEAPFAFNLLPAGVELTGVDQDSMQFHGSDGVSVHVRLDRPDSGLPTGTPEPTEPADVPTGTPEPTEPADVPTGTPEPSEPADVPTGTPEPSEPVGTPAGEWDLSSPPPPQPTVIEVAGRTAVLSQWSERTELSIPIDDGWVLEITGFQMNPDDLIQVAEGIEINE